MVVMIPIKWTFLPTSVSVLPLIKLFSLYILPLINGALVSTAETKYAECAVESENNVHTRNGSMLL